MKAIVNVSVCSLLAKPTRKSTLLDEALYGMVVEILEEPVPGWYKVRTHYRYEGFVEASDLLLEAVDAWEALPKRTVYHKNTCDVLAEAKVQGYFIQSVPRGGVVAPVGEAEKGWQKVRLADGQEGYMPAAILAPHYTAPMSDHEPTLRQALVDAALTYQGTHYRWGGKSPLGIDCSGMVSMAYMLCGILIYRDADIREGFPIRKIPQEEMRTGDLIFFPGHVAMYMGNGRYCHSTGRNGDNGFAINSLDPRHHDYRADLKEQITQVGTFF